MSEDDGMERVIMPVSPYTNDVMKALPAALRPNPYSIDEEVMKAVEKGWDTDALAKAAYINDKHPNPAFVVTNIRRLSEYSPKVETKRTGWDYGHMPCELHQDCELCRCIPGQVLHHVSANANGRKIVP
jgi:hypothetical protein